MVKREAAGGDGEEARGPVSMNGDGEEAEKQREKQQVKAEWWWMKRLVRLSSDGEEKWHIETEQGQ